ncbi:glycosyltransferase [Lachnoclostridium sp. Marseille-P6806]|uniref:glycosyltransferase n=1 Tax=Lachnoclostridium sp. Marseille-P6806 TaxID=2364793 RepID=UPI001032378D|nr:glycosyltransferase [Lachnoclostridium sp. Marseille-P6806]
MQRVGVVVLNFNNYEETIRCTDSLLAQRGIVLSLVIVDNGSANDSCGRLRERYEMPAAREARTDEEKQPCHEIPAEHRAAVTLIHSPENLGFAGGMNLGIDELRGRRRRTDTEIRQLRLPETVLRESGEPADFIFLANSDLVFSDPYILQQMVRAWEPGVGVVNPMVVNTDGSPALRVHFRAKYLCLRMLKTYFPVLETLRSRRRRTAEKEAGKEAGRSRIERGEYTVVGCGYMYGPDFFRHYDRMYPETFLYGEEYATILYLHKAGLCTMLAETAPIIHRHGASTPADLHSDPAFREKMRRRGHNVLVRLMLRSEQSIQKKYGSVSRKESGGERWESSGEWR